MRISARPVLLGSLPILWSLLASAPTLAVPPAPPPGSTHSAWQRTVRASAERHPKPAALDTSLCVFHDVSVVPMDRDTVLSGMDVAVRNGRIQSIERAGTGSLPKSARTIEGRGSYLMPSLADLHVHLRYLSQAHETPAMLRLFVANGVTTVLNLLGLPEHLALRDSIARASSPGPMSGRAAFT